MPDITSTIYNIVKGTANVTNLGKQYRSLDKAANTSQKQNKRLNNSMVNLDQTAMKYVDRNKKLTASTRKQKSVTEMMQNKSKQFGMTQRRFAQGLESLNWYMDKGGTIRDASSGKIIKQNRAQRTLNMAS